MLSRGKIQSLVKKKTASKGNIVNTSALTSKQYNKQYFHLTD